MELYFSPMACSMASRISFYEAGHTPTFREVDPLTKTVGGADYRAVNPLGLVPALRIDDGEVVTENAAVLQYIASRFPDAQLGGATAQESRRLQQWLSFVGTELHRLFGTLLDRHAPENVHAHVIARGRSRLDHVARHLEGRDFLLDRFTVADAYLGTVLTWARATSLSLDAWPALVAYVARFHERPSVERALGEEYPLYVAEQQREKAARAAAVAAVTSVPREAR